MHVELLKKLIVLDSSEHKIMTLCTGYVILKPCLCDRCVCNKLELSMAGSVFDVLYLEIDHVVDILSAIMKYTVHSNKN